MSAPDGSQRIDERLEELDRRNRSVGDGRITKRYVSGRGYHGLDLAADERQAFAISLATLDGERYDVGDTGTRFPLQSISKVFAYGLALEDRGREEVLDHVGVEPSGDDYSSIVFDEYANRPYNPMVNAGALVTVDLVQGADVAEKVGRVLKRMRLFAGNNDLEVDPDTLAAELRTADRNRATAYLMRAEGMLGGDVEETLEIYLGQCSVMVSSGDVAMMAATLANGGLNPRTGERALARRYVRDVLTVMYTCGMYDYAGQWAFEVGVPAKSGVSGGTLAAIPGKLGIGVFSPGLDRYGNSVRGVRVCEQISGHLGLHIFATEAEDVILGPVTPP